MREWALGLLLGLVAGTVYAQGGTREEFSRKNTWTIFAEESQTSSHILLGLSRQRKLVDLGVGYTRRLVRFRGMELGYRAEVRPVLFESDPLTIDNFTAVETNPGVPTLTYTGMDTVVLANKCVPSSQTFTLAPPPGSTGPTETVTDNNTCGRQWTAGQAFSPLGFKWSVRAHHAVQPFFGGSLGYMYTSRPVPVANAESFNFLFHGGPGVEIFRGGRRSVSVELLYSHFSNRNTAEANPGVDNMLLKLSYSFGR